MSVLRAVVLTALLAGPASAETVAYWRFEGNGDSAVNAETYALEVSPSVQYSENVPGATVVDEGKKLPNKSSYAGGSSDLGSVLPNATVLEELIGLGSFTIEGFVNMSEAGGEAEHMRIIGTYSDQAKPGGWSLGVGKGRLTFGGLQTLATDDNSSPAMLAAVAPLTPGKWHHVAVVGYRNPEMLVVRMFIDGSEVEVEHRSNFFAKEADGMAIRPNEGPVLISTRNAFQGEIDEIRISDAALDPSEFLIAETK